MIKINKLFFIYFFVNYLSCAVISDGLNFVKEYKPFFLPIGGALGGALLGFTVTKFLKNSDFDRSLLYGISTLSGAFGGELIRRLFFDESTSSSGGERLHQRTYANDPHPTKPIDGSIHGKRLHQRAYANEPAPSEPIDSKGTLTIQEFTEDRIEEWNKIKDNREELAKMFADLVKEDEFDYVEHLEETVKKDLIENGMPEAFVVIPSSRKLFNRNVFNQKLLCRKIGFRSKYLCLDKLKNEDRVCPSYRLAFGSLVNVFDKDGKNKVGKCGIIHTDGPILCGDDFVKVRKEIAQMMTLIIKAATEIVLRAKKTDPLIEGGHLRYCLIGLGGIRS